MNIKILATADLHLGKQSSDVAEDYASTKHTLRRIVNYCIDKSVDVLLLCGDIVDWDNRFFEAYGPLQSAFDSLGKHGIEVYLVAGNHDFDVLPHIIKTGNNKHVHLLGRNEQWEVQEFTKNGQTIQFVGWSFAQRYVKESAMNTWNPSLLNPNYQTIGLLHGDIGATDSNYGPIGLNDLQNTDVALWILGHIHKPQKHAARPIVWYTGSPQALSAKEPEMHGPLLIIVEPHQSPKVEHIAMSPIRYENISIDVTGVSNENELRDRVIYDLNEDAEAKKTELEEVLSLVYHITLVGKNSKPREIDYWKRTIVEHTASLEGSTTISVRRVDTQISPQVADLNQLAQQSSPAGMLANTILAIEEGRDDPFLDDLINDWTVKVDQANRARVYTSLPSGRKLETTPAMARIAIKDECNRLLGELMNQIAKPN
ncbi:MAG: DNA repair exonuclease [Bacteroidales bacterium]|nr:DNA repair exonuclease [Bacteroidales bacterium]